MGRGRNYPTQGDIMAFDGSEYRPLALSVIDQQDPINAFPDNGFSIIGDVDNSKVLVFQVDTQTTGTTLTISIGAQNASRTLNIPVLAGTDTIAALGVANVFTENLSQTGAKTFSTGTGAVTLNGAATVVAGKTLTVGANSLDADYTGFFGTAYVSSVGSGNAAYHFVALSNVDSGAGAAFYGAHTRGTGTDANTIVQINDELLHVGAVGADGAAFQEAGNITFEVDATPHGNDMPGRIVFRTTPDGSTTPAEALRIDNTQKVIVKSGKSFQLGAAYAAATLVATGSVTMYDSTGTAYRFLCLV